MSPPASSSSSPSFNTLPLDVILEVIRRVGDDNRSYDDNETTMHNLRSVSHVMRDAVDIATDTLSWPTHTWDRTTPRQRRLPGSLVTRLRDHVRTFWRPAWLPHASQMQHFTRVAKIECTGIAAISDLSALRGCTWLRHLECGYTQVTDVAPLANLKLVSLNLDGCLGIADFTPIALSVTLQDLSFSPSHNEHLMCAPSGLRNLRLLHHTDPGVDDVTALARCTALEALSISRARALADLSPLGIGFDTTGCAATLTALDCCSSGVRKLPSGCSVLTSLCCNNTPLSDVSPLTSCWKTLQALTLASTNVADLTMLKGAPSLCCLDVSHTRKLRAVPELPALESLDMHQSAASTLGACTSLHTLNVCSTATTLAAPISPVLRTLKGWEWASPIALGMLPSSLETLDLSNTVLPYGLRFDGLTGLRYLSLAWSNMDRGGGLSEVLAGCHRLVELDLQGSGIRGALGTALQACRDTLVRLDLSHTNVHQGSSSGLVHTPPFARLSELDLSHTQTDDGDMRSFIPLCAATLTWLGLESTDVGDDDLKPLASCGALTHLDISGCKRLRPNVSWVPMLRASCPRLCKIVVDPL